MELTMWQKIRNSVIQLVLGIILVWLASWYLSGHPAEWQSIKSSVSTAQQKVSKLVGSIRGVNSWDIVSIQRTQAIGSMKEIISAIKSCDPTASVAETQALYDAINNSTIEDFARNGASYYNQMNVSYQKMQQLCSKTPETLDK